MIRALYSAASGMTAQQLNIDNIANNLANVNTTGFKARRSQFQDLLYQTMTAPGSSSGQSNIVPVGLQLGLGTRAASNEISFQQGSFTSTGNPLDLVIEGGGFFQILQPNGNLAYTRNGNFQLNATGSMVTPDGYLLQPQVTFPPAAQSITIGLDGTVTYTLPGQTQAQNAGQITLANFQNPAGLNSLGESLFTPTDASGAANVGVPGGAEGQGTVLQGYAEQSNVSVVNEFINMITSQRAYEANSKVVKAADEMYQQANNLRQ
jgi:flagellar basal-body rod protein FlgG